MDQESLPIADPKPRAPARRPQRANIAGAIVKLTTELRRGRDVTRAIETIALSLDRDGDAAGAGEVRGLLPKPGEPPRALHFLGHKREDEMLTWHDPVDVSGEMVVFGDAGTKLESLVAELAAVHRFIAEGIDAPSRVLFVGPSGVGKTLAARWLGWKLGLPVAVCVLDRTTASFMGDTAKNVAKAFDAAEATPSVLFLDEIDALAGARTADDSSAAREKAHTTSALLQRLDGLAPTQIVIAATNLVNLLDGALVRRLPLRLDFKLPDYDARLAMIERWLFTVPETRPGWAQLAADTVGFSCAETRASAMMIGRAAVMRREG